ncbi:glycosyltransferase family 4 protein [Bacteroidales bacterium]|nr:glycosyltransferase family 4 protein [Bacteroidales bacterium]
MLTLLFRKKRTQANSFEQVFEPIIPLINKLLAKGEQGPQHAQVKKVEVPFEGGTPLTIIRNLRFLRKYLRSHTSNITSPKLSLSGAEVLHITGEIHYCAIFSPFKKTILTIHDCKSSFNGNPLRDLYMKIFWYWLPALFIHKITTISKQSAEEIKKLIPFAKKKIVVIPNPYNPDIIMGMDKEVTELFPDPFPERSRRGIQSASTDGRNNKSKIKNQKSKVLFIGTKPNKNLERTIEALSHLENIHLTILGKLTDLQKVLLDRYGFIEIKNEKLKIVNNKSYFNLFNLPFSEVINLYYSHSLLLFPSTYEGFGMPIIEAQAARLPVITSDLSSMSEVAGGAAHLVDPYSVDSIFKGIEKIFNDDGYRYALVQKGRENIKRFEPEYIAKQYLNLYNDSIA